MTSIVTTIAAAIALNSNALGPACPNIERTAVLMGTTLRAGVCHASRPGAMAAIEAGFREVARLEAVLSSWTRESEVGAINAAPARARVSITPELEALLGEAERWVRATDGAFDPAVGALIDAWGFRGEPRVPAAAALATALELTGWHHARLNGATLERGPAGWWLDTGGFGKGAALRSFATVLRAHGVNEAVVDFGGQLLVLGESVADVASPVDRARSVLRLRVRDVSVATSSQSERFIESGGNRYGHILDPRTGVPVPAWGSVTVVTGDALAADALSTALFVMGPDAALAWAKDRPAIGVLVLEDRHGVVRASHNRALEQWLEAK